jgi:hypothetical protein
MKYSDKVAQVQNKSNDSTWSGKMFPYREHPDSSHYNISILHLISFGPVLSIFRYLSRSRMIVKVVYPQYTRMTGQRMIKRIILRIYITNFGEPLGRA